MLKKRIVPKLLIDAMAVGPRVRPVLVRTRDFDEKFRIGDPVSQARIYEAQMADELALLNISGRPISQISEILAAVEKLAAETFMPLTVGGGVMNIEDISMLLQTGADKVIVNSAALENPEFITSAAETFGSQCIVVGIDFRRASSGVPVVMTDRARQKSNRQLFDWAREAVAAGAGELIVTDADRDGSCEGLDIAIFADLTSCVAVPVVGSGGVGLSQHFTEGLGIGGLEGVGAGTFFTLRDQNPMQARAHVWNAGIPIRYKTV